MNPFLFPFIVSLCLQFRASADPIKPTSSITSENRRQPSFSDDSSHFKKLIKTVEMTKKWESARSLWQQAISFAEKNDNDNWRLLAYQGMGSHYMTKGSFLEAAYYFHLGLRISEKTNNRKYQIKSYESLGVAYSDAGDTVKSLQAHHAAVKLAKGFDKRLYLSALNDIGNVYFHSKNYLKALEYYQRSIERNWPIDSMQQSWFLVNTAAAYGEMNNLDASLKTYNELFNYAKYFTTIDSIEVYARLGQLYIKKNRGDLGLKCGLLAKKIAKGTKNFYPLSLVYKTLAEAYRSQGNWEKASLYENRFFSLRDSVLSQEQRQRLEGVKVGYESEKRREKVLLLNEEMQDQQFVNTLLLVGVIVFGLLGLIIIYFNVLLRKGRMKIEIQKNEISEINNSLELRVESRTLELRKANDELVRKNKEIEEALLKGQTLERKRVAAELHDNLGGTLTAIQWYMDSLMVGLKGSAEQNAGYDDLYGMITRAYGEVRLLAHHMMPEVLENDGLEVALHELAVPINKSNRLKVTVETESVSPFLNIQQKFEIYSIALELCTNILKHAKASDALIKLNKTDSHVCLSVKDNGVGLPKTSNRGKMGLKNIQNRLDSIGGQLAIYSETNLGTVVSVMVPLTMSLLEPEVALDRN